eukprot:476479_1
MIYLYCFGPHMRVATDGLNRNGALRCLLTRIIEILDLNPEVPLPNPLRHISRNTWLLKSPEFAEYGLKGTKPCKSKEIVENADLSNDACNFGSNSVVGELDKDSTPCYESFPADLESQVVCGNGYSNDFLCYEDFPANDNALSEVEASEASTQRNTRSEPQLVMSASDVNMGAEIARGNFGRVHSATWRGADVVVKRVSLNKLGSTCLSSILREAGLWERLSGHPNVVRFCGAEVVENSAKIEKDSQKLEAELWLVSEWVTRGSLRCLLNDRSAGFSGKHSASSPPMEWPKPLDWETRVCMARDTAAGLWHLHSEGILHCDLACRNLMVDDKFRIKIADFGMSRFNRSLENQSDATYGPLKWMAPESLSDRKFSTSSDIWSFGIVLWELLSLASEPYPDMTVIQAAQKVVS